MKNYATIIAAIACMLFTTSCVRTDYTVLDLIPADAEFAAVFSPTKSAKGITVAQDNTLQFPAEFTNGADGAVAKDIEAVNKVLAGSGINLDSMAVYMPTYADKPVYVLKLDDTDRFVDRLTALGYYFLRGQQGIKVYCTDSDHGAIVATRGNTAVLIDREGSDADDMWRCFYIPDENPMSRGSAPGTFVKGDTAQAIQLPADLKRALSTAQPTHPQILLLVKSITSIL